MAASSSNNSPQISGLSTQKIDYTSLFARLRGGYTLITGNSRLARILTGQYNQWRTDQGDRQWLSPDIVSWSSWIDKLWEAAALGGVSGAKSAVPNQRQLISLWQATLKNEPLVHELLRPESLANQLLDTRTMIVDWELDLKDPSWSGDENENYTAFYQWNKAFETRCKNAGWISPEDRTRILRKTVNTVSLLAPANIDLLGFDEFNPAQQGLLCALSENGHTISRLAIESRQKNVVLWKSKDSRHELEHMARWARYWLEREPSSSIAIVVPDLQNRRQVIKRQLDEILTPGHGAVSGQAKPWNISMGTPLAKLPMIETAFDLLQLLGFRIDIQEIGRVLRSPWLQGAVTERGNRALLEKCLRENYPRHLTLGEIRYRAGEIKTFDHHRNELPEDQRTAQGWNSPQFLNLILKLIHFRDSGKRSRQPSEWAESIDQLLLDIGWPSAKDLLDDQDKNWQVLQAWREALRELASLDATIPKLDRQTAINQLKQICHEKIFQARTPPAPVQVLGLYEINGLRFDHLWVVGLHNDNWPPSARPNPFIPGKLQQAASIPNSSPQRELGVARTITRRLFETAPDCVFSYPGQLDGEDVFASPLLDITELEEGFEPPYWQADHWLKVVANADEPQTSPLMNPGPLIFNTARGGSTILRHQALCPFRAFASNRLAADGLETPADGISPMLHGSLVHSVLENFWIETKTQAALLKLDQETLSTRVQHHVRSVAAEERGLKQRPAFREVEEKRVHRHVLEFLEMEKQREDFEVVGFEEEILPDIEGISVRLIIDRIDRLSSGEEVIMDYKTGKVEPKKWFGERPEDPQLPLYAISASQTPAAVVFATIREDGCLYKGVVKRGGLIPGLPPKAGKANQNLIDAGIEMPKTIENWRQIIHHLMADFLAGEAAVDPKHGLKTCDNSYCSLQPLCRITELEQGRNLAETRVTTGVST